MSHELKCESETKNKINCAMFYALVIFEISIIELDRNMDPTKINQFWSNSLHSMPRKK